MGLFYFRMPNGSISILPGKVSIPVDGAFLFQEEVEFVRQLTFVSIPVDGAFLFQVCGQDEMILAELFQSP